MSIPVSCRTCGYQGTARSIRIENSMQTTIQGGSEDCPRCGGRAEFQSGIYDFVGTIITAFRGLPRNNIAAFRDIAEAVQQGITSSEQAKSDIAFLGNSFEEIWRWTNQNAGALALLIAIAALYLQITSNWSDDETSLKLQSSIDNQTQIERMILSEIRKQNLTAQVGEEKLRYGSEKIASNQQKQLLKATHANRHQRRKATAQGRKLK